MSRTRLRIAGSAAALGTLSLPMALAGATPAQAASTTYYVSPSGSDTNPGTSAGLPFKTLQKAADLTKPGDTVSIMKGTYTESADGQDVLTIRRSGSAGLPITYKPYPGDHPVIHPVTGWNGINISGASYIRIQGLEVAGDIPHLTLADAEAHAVPGKPKFNTNCVAAYKNTTTGLQSHHIDIIGNDVHDCPGGGISAIDADHVTIDHNRVHTTSWYNVYATSGISILRALDSDKGDPGTYKIRITDNVVNDNETKIKWHDCDCYSDGNGIIVDTLKGKPAGEGADYNGRVLVANNLSFDNGGSGIHSFKSQHVDIVGNTAYYNSRSSRQTGYANVYALQSTDVRLLDNISYARAGKPTNLTSGNQNVTYDSNIYFNGAAPETTGPHDLVADPKLVNPGTDPSTADFRLRADSPAVDSGAAFPAVDKDLDGNGRPAGSGYDRGAYERTAESTGAEPQGHADTRADAASDTASHTELASTGATTSTWAVWAAVTVAAGAGFLLLARLGRGARAGRRN
ncbi:choice-of-anchor Q domain-containing protein [Streptomyces sp. NPDC097595]|uniref:choice-of-anchor Q domain-containing protein n=1 Tax=Streptomyces sp. NPDC097595 TaxID=3366090 RepID=UPI003825716E